MNKLNLNLKKDELDLKNNNLNNNSNNVNNSLSNSIKKKNSLSISTKENINFNNNNNKFYCSFNKFNNNYSKIENKKSAITQSSHTRKTNNTASLSKKTSNNPICNNKKTCNKKNISSNKLYKKENSKLKNQINSKHLNNETNKFKSKNESFVESILMEIAEDSIEDKFISLIKANSKLNLNDFKNMIKLSLIQQNIVSIECILKCKYFHQLTYLNLNENLISSLENIEKLVTLTELHICFNKITKIDKNILQLSNLKKLWLCENYIKEIENIPNNISQLWLAGNFINCIDQDYSFSNSNRENILELNISGNNISTIEDIMKLAYKPYYNFSNKSSTPKNEYMFKNMKILYLNHHMFDCNPICLIDNYIDFVLNLFEGRLEEIDNIDINTYLKVKELSILNTNNYSEVYDSEDINIKNINNSNKFNKNIKINNVSNYDLFKSIILNKYNKCYLDSLNNNRTMSLAISNAISSIQKLFLFMKHSQIEYISLKDKVFRNKINLINNKIKDIDNNIKDNNIKDNNIDNSIEYSKSNNIQYLIKENLKEIMQNKNNFNNSEINSLLSEINQCEEDKKNYIISEIERVNDFMIINNSYKKDFMNNFYLKPLSIDNLNNDKELFNVLNYFKTNISIEFMNKFHIKSINIKNIYKIYNNVNKIKFENQLEILEFAINKKEEINSSPINNNNNKLLDNFFNKLFLDFDNKLIDKTHVKDYDNIDIFKNIFQTNCNCNLKLLSRSVDFIDNNLYNIYIGKDDEATKDFKYIDFFSKIRYKAVCTYIDHPLLISKCKNLSMSELHLLFNTIDDNKINFNKNNISTDNLSNEDLDIISKYKVIKFEEKNNEEYYLFNYNKDNLSCYKLEYLIEYNYCLEDSNWNLKSENFAFNYFNSDVNSIINLIKEFNYCVKYLNSKNHLNINLEFISIDISFLSSDTFSFVKKYFLMFINKYFPYKTVHEFKLNYLEIENNIKHIKSYSLTNIITSNYKDIKEDLNEENIFSYCNLFNEDVKYDNKTLIDLFTFKDNVLINNFLLNNSNFECVLIFNIINFDYIKSFDFEFLSQFKNIVSINISHNKNLNNIKNLSVCCLFKNHNSLIYDKTYDTNDYYNNLYFKQLKCIELLYNNLDTYTKNNVIEIHNYLNELLVNCENINIKESIEILIIDNFSNIEFGNRSRCLLKFSSYKKKFSSKSIQSVKNNNIFLINNMFEACYMQFALDYSYINYRNNESILFSKLLTNYDNSEVIILIRKDIDNFKDFLIEYKIDLNIHYKLIEDIYPNIKYINLSVNKLNNISYIFNFNNLIELNVSSNLIDNLLDNKESLEEFVFSSLKILNLNNNLIKNFDSFSRLFPNLKILSADNNLITSIKPIENIKLLEQLSLSNNKISNIKEILFLKNLKFLTNLDLTDNPLIYNAYYSNKSIYDKLNNDNNADFMSYALYYLKKLTVLNNNNVLRNDKIKSNEYFEGKLTMEIIEENYKNIDNFKNLTKVVLKSHKLKDKESLFDNSLLPKVIKLDLSNNLFSSFKTFGNMSNLKELKLAFNKFECILNSISINKYEKIDKDSGIGCLGVK